MRILCAISLIVIAVQVLAAGGPVDRSGSWDVNAPAGSPTQTLDFTTSEGTWMNLDVHPDGRSLVFDLLGDLYLLPVNGGKASRLTEGAAYDFQPRFSPDGKHILFTSDRGGIGTIWTADFDGQSLSNLKAINDSKANFIDGANWTPDGDWILARKRITDTSAIGISELWLFHKDGGTGIKLIADKGEVDSFHATADQRYVYYGASGAFNYGRNPHGQVWSINRYDRKTGEQRPISTGNGSSASPVPSPDGSRIAFIRRVGTASTLWLHNVTSGAEHQIWGGLDRDQIEAFATHGVYPNYDWTPDGAALIVWAGGKINRVPVDGSETAVVPFLADVSLQYHKPLRSMRNPSPDNLSVKLIRWPTISPDGEAVAFSALGRLYWMQLPDGIPRRVTDSDSMEFSPSFSPDGETMLFTSWNDNEGGALHAVSWRHGTPGRPRTLYKTGSQLVNPAWSPDGGKIIVVAGSGANLRGQDLGEEQRLDILVLDADGKNGPTTVTSSSNRGFHRRITRPTFSADGERIWFFDNEKQEGGGERGERKPPKTLLASVKLDGTDRKDHMQFRYAQEIIVSPDETMVAFTELHNAYVTTLPRTGQPVEFDPTSAATAFKRLSRDGGEWVSWSKDGKFLQWAFGETFHRLPVDQITLSVEDEGATATDDGIRVLEVSIDEPGTVSYEAVTGDLKDITPLIEKDWQNAAQVRIDVSVDEQTPLGVWTELQDWAHEAKVDIKLLPPYPRSSAGDAGEITAEGLQRFVFRLEVPRARPEGWSAFTGARIITMRGDEVIDRGTVVIHGNRIQAVGPVGDVEIPAGAEIFDVSGKTLMPGLVDVHAHMSRNVLDVNPQKDWAYYANLAYGVTTTHDPAGNTQIVFGQSEMVEAGIMVGPRIFSTGFILYGALTPDMAVINSYADALSHVRRLKKLGAFSVKSYAQPRRDQRQWLIRAAASEGMLVMPEGAGDFSANMTMLMDGHSGIEHALPVGRIYGDVVRLFATTRAGYTATLLVAYGGQQGENWFYQHDDVWKNGKLQSFYPPREIDARSRRRLMSAEDDFNHRLVAMGLKQIDDAGGLITFGAHGQLQGLGAHWELWAMAQGGMAPLHALRAATINSAEYLGLDAHLGSIEPGKLADLIVLDKDPLEDIRNSNTVRFTVVNGAVYESDSMDQLWPEHRARGQFLFQ